MKPTNHATPARERSLRFALCCLFALGTAMLAGCIVTSVYPFYDAKSISFEPRLLGQWAVEKESGEPDEHWNFEPEKADSFKVSFTSNQKTNVMIGHTFKLNGELFLDLLTGEISDDPYPPPIPAHMLIRLTEVAATVRMVPLNYDWLTELLEKDPKILRHHIIRDNADEKKENQRVVLTADTAELQRFVVAHLKTAEAWKEEMKLKKKSRN